MASEENTSSDETGQFGDWTRRSALRTLGAAAVGVGGLATPVRGTGATDGGSAAIVAATTGSVVQSGDTLSQSGVVLATDRGVDDFFGRDIAVTGDGETLLVGADGEDANGDRAGSAYVFGPGETTGGSTPDTTAATVGEDHLDPTVDPRDSGVVYLGQVIEIQTTDSGLSAGDVVNVVAPGDGGELLAQRVVEDGRVRFDTEAIENLVPASGYELQAGADIVAEFQVLVQAYAVGPDTVTVGAQGPDTTAEIPVTSQNRIGHTHVVSAPAGLIDDLQSALTLDGVEGSLEDVDGDGLDELVFPDGSTEDVFTVDGSEFTLGTHDLEFEASDTTAADSVEVTVELRNGPYAEAAHLTAGGGAPDDRFGTSVALAENGETALVGAPGVDRGVDPDAGTAYVFERRSDGWTETATLVPDGASDSSFVGSSVALSADGTVAAVGAPGGDGSVSVFTRSGSTWRQQATLAPSDASFFGSSLTASADATTLLVGAPQTGTADGDDAGSAHVFVRDGDSWTETARLTADDGAPDGRFGSDVALSADGTLGLVGAPGSTRTDDDGGTVYALEASGETWEQTGTLRAGAVSANDQFGDSVALSDDGETAVVGATAYSTDNYPDTAGAFLFERGDGDWRQTGTAGIARNSGRNLGYGEAVALAGDDATAFVGGLTALNTGLVYLYDTPPIGSPRFDDGDGDIQAREVLKVIAAYNDGDDLSARDVLAVIDAYNTDASWDAVDLGG